MARYKHRSAGYKQRRKPKTPIKYRDNMTDKEAAALLAECNRLDALYASAGDCSPPLDDEESQAYFDRYIAGDRL